MEQSSLKKTLLDNIEIQEEVRKTFHEILRRQTMTFISAIFMMIIGLGAFIVVVTSPTKIDKSLVRYIENERSHIVQERARMATEKRLMNAEREMLNKERELFLKTKEALEDPRESIFPYNIIK